LRGREHVFEFVNEAYVRLLGDRNFVGKTVREAVPEVEGQGFFELLDRVYSTGERFIAQQIPISLVRPQEAVQKIDIWTSFTNRFSMRPIKRPAYS
jgi:hypothetical protein